MGLIVWSITYVLVLTEGLSGRKSFINLKDAFKLFLYNSSCANEKEPEAQKWIPKYL
jgi:hypothetical protein